MTNKRARPAAKRAKPMPEIRRKRPRNPHPLLPPVEHRFKPGQSGNPGGRPKLLGESYKQMLARVNEADPLGRTNAELMAEAAKIEGFKGNIQALREIRQATEGDLFRLGTMTDGELRELIAARFAAAGGGAEQGDTAAAADTAADVGDKAAAPDAELADGSS